MTKGLKITLIVLVGIVILIAAWYFLFYRPSLESSKTLMEPAPTINCKDYGNLSTYDRKWCRDNGLGPNVSTQYTVPGSIGSSTYNVPE